MIFYKHKLVCLDFSQMNSAHVFKYIPIRKSISLLVPQRPGGPPRVGPPITSWTDGMPGAAPQNRWPAPLPSAPGLQPPLRWGQGSVGE